MLLGLIDGPLLPKFGAGIVFPKFDVIGPMSLKTELKQYSQPSPGPPPPLSSIGSPQ